MLPQHRMRDEMDGAPGALFGGGPRQIGGAGNRTRKSVTQGYLLDPVNACLITMPAFENLGRQRPGVAISREDRGGT